MKDNLKKRMLKFLKYIFLVFLIPFIFVLFLILSGFENQSDKQVDYVIILGGRVYGDKPSRSLNERIKTAIKYLKKHRDIKVIASGGTGKGENISEAEAIKRELIRNGIDENRIIKEDKSTNTVENLKFSQVKIKENESKNKEEKIKILIVTNDYHIYRAKKIANLLNYEAYGLGAPTPLISLPKSYLREFASIIKYYFIKNSIK